MAKKFSQFPSAPNIGAGDTVVGLKNGENVRFSFSTSLSAIQSLFVPVTRTINGKTLEDDISLDASDVGAVDASDVGVADGVASLDSTGKVPSSQLPAIPSDAADITYDPTTSGLSATDVQAAIDEVQGEIGNLPSPPDPSDATPQDLGTAAAGSSADYSRADHVHNKPTAADVGAQPTITANGILKGDGQGGVSAAVAGTDYQAPLTAGTDYATPTQLVDKANQSQLATVETGSTASRTYAVGEYFCWNGLLYRVKTAISSGASFTPGTNCEQVTEGGLNATQGKLQLVWTNTGTSVAFAGQTLSIDLSQYDLVLIEHLPERSLVSAKQSYVCRIGNGTDNIQSMYLPSGATTPSLYQRTISVTISGITFGDGFSKPTTATARTTDNNAIHPRTIYGIKL